MHFLAAATLLLTLSACDPTLTFLAGEDWQAQGGTRFTQTHWQGSNADATTKTAIVARSQTEWDALWKRVNTTAPGPLPRNKMAVAVLAGQRANTGYAVEIVKAGKEFLFGQVERYNVEYRMTVPRDTARAVGAKPASPWAIRLSEYREGDIDFNEVK
jgi:hypothetical protein